jgi:hypothetical protein
MVIAMAMTEERMDERFDRLEKMLHTVVELLAESKASIKKVHFKVDHVNSELKQVKDGQDRHERVMEILSLKTVYNESEINEIKRRL